MSRARDWGKRDIEELMGGVWSEGLQSDKDKDTFVEEGTGGSRGWLGKQGRACRRAPSGWEYTKHLCTFLLCHGMPSAMYHPVGHVAYTVLGKTVPLVKMSLGSDASTPPSFIFALPPFSIWVSNPCSVSPSVAQTGGDLDTQNWGKELYGRRSCSNIPESSGTHIQLLPKYSSYLWHTLY